MKKVVPVVAVSVALGLLAWVLAPHGWQWPAVGTVLFVGFFIAARLVATAIGDAAEERFRDR